MKNKTFINQRKMNEDRKKVAKWDLELLLHGKYRSYRKLIAIINTKET